MFLIELLKVIFLGIVEGITEWLPVSSTGHMILVEEFIKLDVSPEFKKMFLVVIQLGAIMAVVLSFFNKLNPFCSTKTIVEKKEAINLWSKIIIGVLPAAVLGLLFDDWLDANLYNYTTVSITLIVYGILFIVVENRNRDRASKINTFKDLGFSTAFLIGMFQVLALIPGTSRSGATIIGGMLLGTSRFIAAEYSFFLSIPVMFGASALKLVKFGFDFTSNELIILVVGMIVAFAVSVLAIRFLMNYIKNHDFKAFGYYRIVLGAVVLLYFLVLK